jgi:hypothetical protein
MEYNLQNEIINNRKIIFIEWLSNKNKPNGSLYQERTILTYANQIEKIILNEFSCTDHGSNLFKITSLSELFKIEKILNKAADNKKRRDLRSAFQCYLKFTENYSALNDFGNLYQEGESYTEGGQYVFISYKAERNVKLRKKAIEIHGTTCMACNFNFGMTYGDWGEGFIEVHHLIPLGNGLNSERTTNPIKDLIVLCANCHRMIHRKKRITLTLEELKNKIKKTLSNVPE